MDKHTVSSLKKRCSKFDVFGRELPEELMARLNMSKIRRQQLIKLLDEKIKKTKLKDYKKEVKQFSPLILAPNEFHKNIVAFAECTITTKMSKFFEKVIFRKVQCRGNLEQKYPKILADIMEDAQDEYWEVTHTTGVISKIKPESGVNFHVALDPYKFPGRTARRPKFLRIRERIQNKLFLPHKMIREVFKMCVATVPEKLIDFRNFRKKVAYDVRILRERFDDEIMISRYLIRTFYKNLVKLVKESSYRHVKSHQVPDYLRACTGLLSIYFSRTVENTMRSLVEVVGANDHVPFLRFSIGFSNKEGKVLLELEPNPQELIDMFTRILQSIALIANNIPVLQSYRCEGYEDDKIPIFITDEFLKDCLTKVETNVSAMCKPLVDHIEEIQADFTQVYNKYGGKGDISFDDGCEYINYYRNYVHKMTGTVAYEYYPIGKLEQTPAVDYLKVVVSSVIGNIFENLCLQHQYINNDICDQFEMLVARATKKPETTEELMELGEYMLWANTVLLTDLTQRIMDSLMLTTKLIELGNLSKDHMELNSRTVNWIYDIKPVLQYNASMFEQTKAEHEQALQNAIASVNKGTTDLRPYMVILDDMDDSDNAREYMKILAKFLSQIRHMDQTIKWINKEEACFKFQISTYKDLEVLRNYLNPFYHLVKLCADWKRISLVWQDGPFEFLNYAEAESLVDNYMKALIKIQKNYRNQLKVAAAENKNLKFSGAVDDPEFTNLAAPIKLCQKIIQQIKDFRPVLALMSALCNDALLQRHWDEMSEVAGVDLTPNAGTTLRKYFDMGLMAEYDKYEIISTAAIKERQILQNLEKMQTEWAELKFKTSSYRDTNLNVLSQLDDVQAILDDHIIKTLSMRGSVFVKPYQDRVQSWYEKLLRINRTIEEWGKCQAQYLYLLPIFSSKDIVAQMPNEGTLFREVQNTYTRYMGVVDRDPRVLETAGAKGLMESMIKCNEMLEKINEGVVKYLEAKRIFFPRFFFLSNDEMLEILTETKNPLRVQPHLRKCFEAVNELMFDEALKIHGMYSQMKEYIPFLTIIDTEEAKGSVEKWLVQVETEMVVAVRDQILQSIDEYKSKPRTQWMQDWPGQVVLAVSQIYWTSGVHDALRSKSGGGVTGFAREQVASLKETVALIRDPTLTNLARITIKALIVIDVHAKDVVEDLADKRVKDDKEFKWLAQLRYYWEDECLVRLINATVKYAYEYLGNTDRLVITPLTDRCYRTLIGAYHLHLNGAPEGPAGTGKTETTKDLAKALAVQCVVFNCSDGLDYKAMGKFFKGLAASGAWACFDEFNRIEIEVLSVVAQQILCIILAVRANAEIINFEGTELKLNPACYVCITMNPGYAGRTELPDNLKVLFRTVAMMVPDYALIGEISLYSYGFIDARKLSVKIVTTYRLCSEQLSSQNHYDYGMRAVKSVLSAAGNIKQKYPDENEDILLLRSIMDVNLPKFLSYDVPLFEGIISDLFPGVILPKADYSLFLEEARKSCTLRNLQPKESFLTKVIQTYEMMIVRHGFMIVGDTFAGKSSTLYVLADTLTSLNKMGQPEEKVRFQIINPKSVTGGQLYGQFDPVSYEWFDGVVATCFRSFAMDTNPDRKWIIFDGPVDAVWIENMNTVLDDNKKLCLMSGEVIAMTDVMSLIFEVMDLAQASPATVSRCGMIYMQAATLGYEPFIQSWIHEQDEEWCGEYKEYIESLFYWLIPPCLNFIRKSCKQLCVPGEIRLVKNMIEIVQMLLDDALEASVKREEDMRSIVGWIQATFVYAGTWGLGSILDSESRSKFDEFYRGLWNGEDEENPYPEEFEKLDILIPFEGQLIDYVFHYRARGAWRYWPEVAKKLRIEEAVNVQQVLVPTVETEKYMYIVKKHITHKKPVLLVGPTGTGKSFYMQDLLMNKLDQEKYEPAFITFTVQISANQAQELVISKLNKRKRGQYGPPRGKTCVIFIDDMSLPAKEVYGAQPPIELIRQYFDHKNFYDLKTTEPIYLYDVLFVAAMGVVGGSRQEVYARFLRHFAIFSINDFDNNSMSKIYANLLLVGLKNNGFPSEVITSVNMIVSATLQIYSEAFENLRPTPAKSHYIFNLRDFSRVIFGCSLLRKDSTDDKNVFVKVWIHEILRVFYDRLVEDKDKDWLFDGLKEIVRNNFKEHFDMVFDAYKDENGNITHQSLQNFMFGTYLDQDSPDDERRYEELLEKKHFTDLAYNCIQEYNATHKNKLTVVLFKYAVEHLSKICRVLSMPSGSALLVGISGSGRQSLTRLASTICQFPLFQPEITKTYGMNEWRDDIKVMLRESGGKGKHCVFLFTEGQMKEEGFLQDIDCLLNSGEVPNIYEIDERQEIIEMVRLAAQGGNRKIDISTLAVFSFFNKRCREKLHIILCFSPIGSSFRTRLRLYPSLINCCTIDWFEDWPEEALEMVAHSCMTEVDVPQEVKDSAVVACKHFHMVARRLSEEFFKNSGRKTYITSASYLELIRSFTNLTNFKQKELMDAKYRYLGGLNKLEFASEQIAKMSLELSQLQPQLQAMSEKATTMARQIALDAKEAERQSNLVKQDEIVANRQAAEAQALKSECEAELALAMPILEDALNALDTLKPADITLVKSMKNPPIAIKIVMAAVCVIKDIKPDRIRDASTGKMSPDYWGPSKRLLGEMTFLQQLKDFDKDNIKPEIIAKIRKEYLPDKSFKPEIVAKASSAAEGLCKWIIAMDMYDKVAKVVAPKKAKLALAEQQYNATMAILNEKKEQVEQLERKLTVLNENLRVASNKQKALSDDVDLCTNKLRRAEQLIGGLGGERTRWTACANDLQAQYDSLAGDILLCCGIISYLSPFTSTYRVAAVTDWHKNVKSLDIPNTSNYSFVKVLGTEVKVQNWYINGLPNDLFSTENGIIMDNSNRYSLFIDPQSQANIWIKKMEKKNNLEVTKFSLSNYMKTLEQCIESGRPVLLENVEEDLEAPLDPILFKLTFKQAGMEVISLGENVIPFNKDFRFYLTSSLRNPHYMPEVFNKVTIINFALTIEGLQDQLLGIVVARERPDLQTMKEEIIRENAKNKGALVQVEENILRTLAESEGDILEDEKAIQILDKSKTISEEIKADQVVAVENEKTIEKSRSVYSVVAENSAVLYYCIADLPNIDPMYQFSLAWFINLYVSSIEGSAKSREIEKRLQSLIETFVCNLYSNVCRSLFEKDKLMFSFVLCTNIRLSKKLLTEADFLFLLTGGVNVENPITNPASDWLSDKSWDEICRVEQLNGFRGFKDNFVKTLNKWQVLYDAEQPQDMPIPEPWESKLTTFEKLIVIRLIRPDKITVAITKYIESEMGNFFTKPPPFNISKSYGESSAICPLIFILSPGTDPMSSLVSFSDTKSISLSSISLGQGQGPLAQSLIQRGQEVGSWVCLQNCHLAVSWMPTLENIWEKMDTGNTHVNFRLWLTSYPSAKFPVSVLKYGVKMTNEPPTGLQQNLLKSYNNEPVKNQDFYKGCEREEMFARLIYALAFFHAVVQERRTFGPLGWNIPYGFNDSDFDISVHQLQMFINENEDPFEAIVYLVGECNYGGRVTDDWDRRLIVAILADFLNPKVVHSKKYMFATVGQGYGLPHKNEYDDYINFINDLPHIHPPEVFGLHMNAGITRSLQDSNQLLDAMIKVHGETHSSVGSETDKLLLMLSQDVLSKIPTKFDIEEAQKRYPFEYTESMNTVLVQEMERFNRLLIEIKTSLQNVQKGVKGIIVMTPALELLTSSLLLGRIPAAWARVSYPSLKSLPNYISDFVERLTFLQKWLNNGKPNNFWIAGFFFTQAFLTGAKQNYARKYRIPIDQLTFDFEILTVDRLEKQPGDGIYVYGLFTDGARWDRKKGRIAEQLPKVLNDTMPLIWLIPLTMAEYSESGRYVCPLYKTSERKGTLSTTGHSTNYVLPFLLDTDLPPSHWIKRSVALLCQLD